jgi:hypothetical protein
MMPNPENMEHGKILTAKHRFTIVDLAMDFRRFTISFQLPAGYQPAKSTLDHVRRIDYLPRCNTIDVGVS